MKNILFILLLIPILGISQQYPMKGYYNFKDSLKVTGVFKFGTSTGIMKTTSGIGSVLSSVPATLGGTGAVNDIANTLTFTGNYSLGLTLTGNTALTLPTSGTLENVLTFSTGLTRSVNAVSSDLITGTAGTKTIIGGTAVGDYLIYKSTTGAGTTTGIAHQFTGGTNGGTVLGTFLNDGKIGFGISPVSKFHVLGDINTGLTVLFDKISADNNPTGFIFRKARGTVSTPLIVTTGDLLGYFVGRGYTGVTNGYDGGARINFLSEGTVSTTAMPGVLAFLTTPAGSLTPTEVMRINSSGYAGIGLTAPTSLLHVGTANAAGNVFQGTLGTITGSTLTDGIVITGDASQNFTINQQENAYLNFKVNNTEAFRINADQSLAVLNAKGFYFRATIGTEADNDWRILTSTTDFTISQRISGTYYKNLRISSDSYNTFIGNQAAFANVSGTRNTFIGNQAGYANTTGEYNVSIGNSAGRYGIWTDKLFIDTHNRTDSANQLISSLVVGTFDLTPANQIFRVNGNIRALSGIEMVLGQDFKFSTTLGATADNDYKLNVSALSYNLTHRVGGTYYDMMRIDTSLRNVFIGSNAGYMLATASGQTDHVAIGHMSNGLITTRGNQDHSTSVGAYSGFSGAAAGSVNIGYKAGYLGGSGVCIGWESGYYANSNTTLNTFVGYESGYGITGATGDNNTALGHRALFGFKSGSNNTAIGYGAGISNSYGSGSVFLGNYAGANGTKYDNKLFIDNQIRADSATDLTGSLIVGTFDATVANQRLNINAGRFTVTGQVVFNQLSGSLTDGVPTDTQIDGITSLTPATAGAGYQVTIKDSDGTGLLYKIESDGTDWYYTVMTKAVNP